MPNLDEEIEAATAQQEEEEERRQQMQEMAVQERMQRVREQQQAKQSQVSQKSQAMNAVKQQAGKQVKKAAKAAAWRAIIATSPYWGTALLIIGGIFLLVILIFTVFVYGCNESNTVKVANFLTWVSSFGQVDMCKNLKIAGINNLIPEPYTGGFTFLVDIPQQYVSMGNFGDRVNDYPRVTPGTLAIIQNIFAQYPTTNPGIVITSALRRPGSYNYSCHMLGEAFDIVLIPPVGNPTNPSFSDDARIRQLMNAGTRAGATFVQDEYRNPSPGATGPHVHFGFGLDPNCVGRQAETNTLLQYGEYRMPY